MKNEFDGYVIYYKESIKEILLALVSDNYDFRAISKSKN